MEGTPPRILVVDDEVDTGALLQRVLGRRGFRVHLAADGREALAALASRRYALLITVLFLPRGDGLRLVEALRHRWPQLPVILMTSRRGCQSYSCMKDLRVVAYLTKPFRISDLQAAVERGLHPPLAA